MKKLLIAVLAIALTYTLYNLAIIINAIGFQGWGRQQWLTLGLLFVQLALLTTIGGAFGALVGRATRPKEAEHSESST